MSETQDKYRAKWPIFKEVKARHESLKAELSKTGARLRRHAQVIFDDNEHLLSEHARLTQELEAEKAVTEFSRETVRIAAKLIDTLKCELAEERAACKIAGHAMDLMRATIDRKDGEIERLKNVTIYESPSDVIIGGPGAPGFDEPC